MNFLPIGNTDEVKTQRKMEGWTKSMTDRGGGTEGDAGDGPLGGGRPLYGGQKLDELNNFLNIFIIIITFVKG